MRFKAQGKLRKVKCLIGGCVASRSGSMHIAQLDLKRRCRRRDAIDRPDFFGAQVRRDSPLPLLPPAQHRREARGLADAGSAEEPPQPVRSKQPVCQDFFCALRYEFWALGGSC